MQLHLYAQSISLFYILICKISLRVILFLEKDDTETILIIYSPVIFRLVALDKEMRPWDTYVSLEATVKNMLTSLRAVGELQNPAIRERHWRQLMNSTKVSLEIAERMYHPFSYNTNSCKLGNMFNVVS